MNKITGAFVAALALSACSGGNPFTDPDNGTPGDGDSTSTIPEAVSNNLSSVSYDPGNQTLRVTGIALDEAQLQDVAYTRKPALDRNGYEAYTVQDSSLDRHSTAYVKQLDEGYAVVVSTGGQFAYYFAGVNYGGENFTAPTSDQQSGGIVSYAGKYVGFINRAGSGEDLLPVTPGTDPSVRPSQMAEVTGDVFINADFVQNQTNGIVYNRELPDAALISSYSGVPLEDLELSPTTIDGNGTFSGNVTVALENRGTYGGQFSGSNAGVVAGGLHAEQHISGFADNIVEFGAFVMGQCGGAHSDPVCNQPVP